MRGRIDGGVMLGENDSYSQGFEGWGHRGKREFVGCATIIRDRNRSGNKLRENTLFQTLFEVVVYPFVKGFLCKW